MAGIAFVDIGEDDGQVDSHIDGDKQAVAGRVETGKATDEDTAYSPVRWLARNMVRITG